MAPWSGSSPNQTYSRTDGTRTGTTVWQEAEGASVDIISTDHDTHDQDLAAAINATLKKDGGNTPSSNLPMGGFRHTNVSDGNALATYASVKQMINSSGYHVPTVGGTGDAVTLTTGMTVTAYATGQRFSYTCSATNGGAMTVAIDGLAAKSVKRLNGEDPGAATMLPGSRVAVEYDGTNFQWVNEFVPFSIGDGVIAVTDRLSAPPGSPTDGAIYLLTGTPTGAWSGYSQHDLAQYSAATATYTRIVPSNGWVAYVIDEVLNYQLQSGAWMPWDNVSSPSPTVLGRVEASYVVSDGTNGGTVGASNNTAYTRALNTLNIAAGSLSGVTLVSNQLLNVPAGTYLVSADLAFGHVDRAHFWIRGTTAGILQRSMMVHHNTADSTHAAAHSTCIITLASADTLYIENMVSNNSASATAAGIANTATGFVETYARIVLVDLSVPQGPEGPEGPQGPIGYYPAGALTLANGANNNVVRAGQWNRIAGPTDVFSITGIVAPTGPSANGYVVKLYNTVGFAMTIANESGSSAAANRILTNTGADVATTTVGVVELVYSTTDSRWILCSSQL